MKRIDLNFQSLNKTWEKQMMDDRDYDVLYDENVEVYKPDGEPLLVLLKGVLDPQKIALAWKALKKFSTPNGNRGDAAGIKREKKKKADGTISNTSEVPASWKVDSGVYGYLERVIRIPYCRPCHWNRAHPDRYEMVLPLTQQVSSLFEKHVPKRYAAQKSYCDRTLPEYIIPGTVYTTVTVNKNFRTACHLDAGDLHEGFSGMAILKDGDVRGGNLVLPNWRAGVKLDHGDVIFFDAHEYHGNTQIVPVSKGAQRCSLVHYYREKMLGCKSMNEEIEIAKNRKTGDPVWPQS